jgi:hypothetical protein
MIQNQTLPSKDSAALVPIPTRAATAASEATMLRPRSPTTIWRRFSHLSKRSGTVLGRAWIGSPARKRSRSSASVSAEP